MLNSRWVLLFETVDVFCFTFYFTLHVTVVEFVAPMGSGNNIAYIGLCRHSTLILLMEFKLKKSVIDGCSLIRLI